MDGNQKIRSVARQINDRIPARIEIKTGNSNECMTACKKLHMKQVKCPYPCRVSEAQSQNTNQCLAHRETQDKQICGGSGKLGVERTEQVVRIAGLGTRRNGWNAG